MSALSDPFVLQFPPMGRCFVTHLKNEIPLSPKAQAECTHESVRPPFNQQAAIGVPHQQVRQRWPRFQGECRECGDYTIKYASRNHYIAGGWSSYP